MSDYKVENGELYHYGVKGMKWGVRRSLGVRARAGAMYKNFADSAARNVKRLEAKKAKKGLTNRQAEKLKTNKRLRKEYGDLSKTLTKDLSQKDIKRGQRVMAARGLLGASRAIFDAADLVRADKEMERMRNR